jgi:enoyl-CoA hydratase/carnithine racemase
MEQLNNTVHLTWPEEKIALVTLNQPASLNAMGEQMAVDFKQIIDQLNASQQARVVILTGAGKAFSAGGDLEMLLQKTKLTADENYRRMRSFYDSFLGFRALRVPVIAALNGAAVGAGLCVACAAHVRVAARSAKLGVTFTKLGLHPGMAATFSLPRIIGAAAAYELMLTGRIISADEALRIGLISQVTDDDAVVDAALAIAREMLQTGPAVTSQLLETLTLAEDDLFEKTLHREASCQAINYAGSEFLEGVQATKEKRKANF